VKLAEEKWSRFQSDNLELFTDIPISQDVLDLEHQFNIQQGKVLSGNSLQIVVSDDEEEEEEEEEIIEGESVEGEAVEGEEREYTVTPARSIASIDLIAHQADFILLEY
jgi:hypothetical protein